MGFLTTWNSTSVSGFSFQPAENEAEGITSTPTEMTYSSALRAGELFRFVSVASTHGYSRFAPAGQFPLSRFGLLKYSPL
jgi:hypothetical protein